jgi:hypothetical protein
MFISKLTKYGILILLCVAANLCYSQRADTTIHKQHYSFCSFYPGMYDRIGLETDEPKTLFCLGNYEDNLKTGHWLYFFPSGQLLAQGNYENGIKTGKWKYCSASGSCSVVEFYAKYPSIEKISFGPGNAPLIYDLRIDEKYSKDLINGMHRASQPVRMLD